MAEEKQFQKPGPQDIEVEPRTDLFQRHQEETDWGSVKITRKGGINYNIVRVTDDYTAKTNDRTIIVQQTSGTKTIILPLGREGKKYTIKAYSANQVDIVGTDSETFDGGASLSITISKDFRTVQYWDFQWYVIGSGSVYP